MGEVVCKVLFIFLDLSIVEGMKLQSSLEVHQHMADRAAEGVCSIMLYLGNGQKQGRSRLGTWSFSFMHQPNRK